MNYVLRNPTRVYRQQRAGRSATYRAEQTAEKSRHVRAVVPVHRLVEQLRPYVVQRCSHNWKKHNEINFLIILIYLEVKTNLRELHEFK
jgi:hypothetical protein